MGRRAKKSKRTKSKRTKSKRTASKRAKSKKGEVLDVLKELLAEGRTEDVLAVVEKLVARNHDLEERLAELRRGRKKNEGVSSAQLQLFLTAVADDSDEVRQQASDALKELAGFGDDEKAHDEAVERLTTPEPDKRPPSRNPLPDHLERVDNTLVVPDDERACPRCGEERKCIGHERTEVAELLPAKVIVRVDLREKLACKQCEGELVRAPQGDKVVTGGRFGPRLVAQLLVDKYEDGLPLHRQKSRYERMGLTLPVSTLADQVTWSTDLLRPLWRAAASKVLLAYVMHVDGTSIPVLDRDAAKGKRLGTLWGYVGDENIALYLYATTGKKKGQKPGELGPEDFLKLRQGYVVADAAGVFDASFKRDDLIECGCNVHARRYFVKALDGGDKRAALVLAAFKKLYKIEADIRDLDSDAKRSERQARSKPVHDGLVSWCETFQPDEPPKSPMGRAIGYLLNHREAFQRFLDDGRIPLDNSIVERLHVRAALTRKNYLFAGSDKGAERAAIAYTIIGSCKLVDVDPIEYLADVLPRLARKIRLVDMPDLLPATWKANRPS